MKKHSKKLISLLTAAVLLFSLSVSVFASDPALSDAVKGSAEYVYQTASNPQVGSTGGEWAVLGLARSGCEIPEEYFRNYYETLKQYTTACGGVLHEKKYTEYSRVIIALTAIGKDPTDVAGYNLLTPLGDFEKTSGQGLNGMAWALLALDSGNYEMPINAEAETQATRQMYIDAILDCQLSDGGWNLTGTGSADPDMTAMALQALAKYQSQTAVKAAVTRALTRLSALQNATGGYSSWGTATCESTAQVIVALCELGVSLNDSRFIKNGCTLLDALLSYRNSNGSFLHSLDGDSGNSRMASEQGFYALVAALRSQTGQNSLYRMGDAISIGEGDPTAPGKGEGLPGKHEDVRSMPITAPGTTFDDIVYSENITAIEALAARGIINGKGGGLFDPDANVTRAEFATIITRGLGLKEETTGVFKDVPSTKWYAGYVGTAAKYGIVNGVGNNMFDPEGTITRQEAATMVARAAKLCGMDVGMSASEIRDMLAQFGDYVSAASWAQESLAFCYRDGILSQSDLNIEPTKPILRCEIAQMLFNMLSCANLI